MKEHHFKQLLKSIDEVRAIRRGEKEPARMFHYASLEVKKIRGKLKLTQAEFAKMICISPATLRNWEQGRTYPEGAAIALLRVADANPAAVLEALHARTAQYRVILNFTGAYAPVLIAQDLMSDCDDVEEHGAVRIEIVTPHFNLEGVLVLCNVNY